MLPVLLGADEGAGGGVGVCEGDGLCEGACDCEGDGDAEGVGCELVAVAFAAFPVFVELCLLLFFFVAFFVALAVGLGAALGVCVAVVGDAVVVADADGVAAVCGLLVVEEPRGALEVSNPVLDCAG